MQCRKGNVDLGAALYREGEYWTFVYTGMVCRVRDAKGLYCLAYLLRHPGEKFAAVDLLTITEESTILKAPTPAGPALGPSGAGASAVDGEEARVLVTKRIRGVVKKIEAYHPSLAHHLGTCIKTGSQCAYLPDPERPIMWATERRSS